MKVDALLKYWNSAAAGCYNNLVCIKKCSYSLDLYDSLWLRSCYDSSVSAISKSGDKVSFLFLGFSFFLSENTSDNFLRICESVVIWIMPKRAMKEKQELPSARECLKKAFCKKSCGKIFLNDGTGTVKVDALLKHWNSTAAGCDNNLVCIEKCSYSLKLYDSHKCRERKSEPRSGK